MSVWSAFFQGIIQGLTEFLPVSSSGHLSVFQYFFGGEEGGSLFFSLMLHLGTLAAVIAAYYEDLWAMLKELGRMIKEIFSGRFHFKTQNPDRKLLYMLFLACLPMVLIIPLRGVVAGISEDNDIVVEGICFLVTSALLFMAVKAKPGKAAIMRMRPRHAVSVGVMQAVATFPGISRSGATISTGMILGFDRTFAVKFSFLLGIPAILGGAVFEIGDAVKEGANVAFLPLFVGMLTAAVVGYICIRLIKWLLRSNRFGIFAWYTLVLGCIVLVLGVVGHIAGWGGEAAGGASSVSQVVSGVIPSLDGGGSSSALAAAFLL